MTLLADVHHPGSQEDLVSNWEPTHSLVKDAISGAEVAPCLPALAVACLTLCLLWGEQPVCSWLAFFRCLLNSLFCEWARLHLRLELYMGRFSFSLFLFFFSSLVIPQFGLLSHVNSLRLFSGLSGPVLTLSMQLVPPCPAPARWWWT